MHRDFIGVNSVSLWSWLAALGISLVVGVVLFFRFVFADDDGNRGWGDFTVVLSAVHLRRKFLTVC